MNKYLLMSAAAAMAVTAATGSAQAGAGMTTIGFTGYCDYFVVHWNGKGIYTAQHVGYSQCGSSVLHDMGIGPKNPRKKKGTADIVDGSLQQQDVDLLYEFSTPFKDGGTYTLWASTNGGSAFILGQGNYMLGKEHGSNTMISDAINALLAHQQ
ncbi:MAG TPA: hypothetical protein VHY79_13485 [Rhizomicrobium sp.]|jgi:hypothetical protein|nr:hypothetical protein [Rhizomicrobium sp.]